MTLTDHLISVVNNNPQLSIIVYLLGIPAMAWEIHLAVSKDGENAREQITSFFVSLLFGFFWPVIIVYRFLQKLMVLLRTN
jgi:hypothetical protein